MKVKELMTATSLYFCTSEATLQHAARIMKEGNCGSLPVVDESQRVIGIITDRDICLSLADETKKMHALMKVKVIMSPVVQIVNIDDTIAVVLKKMRTKRIGRLPVVDNDGKLKGIITIHDILNKTFTGTADLVDVASTGESLSRTIKALNDRYTTHLEEEISS